MTRSNVSKIESQANNIYLNLSKLYSDWVRATGYIVVLYGVHVACLHSQATPRFLDLHLESTLQCVALKLVGSGDSATSCVAPFSPLLPFSIKLSIRVLLYMHALKFYCSYIYRR